MKEKYFTRENIETVTRDIRNKVLAVNPRQKKWRRQGNTALLITDMQYYFLKASSHAYIPSADAIIPNINRLIYTFHSMQRPVILTRHFNRKGDAGMMEKWWKHLIDKTSHEYKITSKIKVDMPYEIIDKEHYDAFAGTRLEELLVSSNTESLVIAGVMTNLCCETTLRSAFVKGYDAVMPLDATAAYNKSYHTSTFINLSFGFSALLNSRELINHLHE
jgi:isochorismate hydrolase